MADLSTAQIKKKVPKFSIWLWIQIALIFLLIGFFLVACYNFITIETTKGDIQLTGKCEIGDEDFTVKLDNAVEMQDGSLYQEKLLYSPGQYWRGNGSTFGCPCLLRICINKCCPPSLLFSSKNNLTCVEHLEPHPNPIQREHFKPSWPGYFLRRQSAFLFELLPVALNENHLFFIFYREEYMENKSFSLINYLDDSFFIMNGSFLTTDLEFVDFDRFCLENSKTDNNTYVASWGEKSSTVFERLFPDFWLFIVIWMLSGLSTVATLLVYLSFPQLHTLHGKLFIQYLASKLVMYYLVPGYVLLNNYYKTHDFMYIIGVSYIVVFNWLTVMSYDVWCNFNKPLKPHKTTSSSHTLILYSVFGWGLPILLVAIPEAYMALTPCPFTTSSGGLCLYNKISFATLFLGVPLIFLLVLNCLLFLFTLCNLYHHFRQTKVLSSTESQRHSSSAVDGFFMYLKLAIITGLYWFLVIVVFPAVIGNVTHSFVGLVEFFVFVCNKRILSMLFEKWTGKMK